MRAKWAYATPLLFLPYLIMLFKSRMCGWDCPYYVYHMGVPLKEMFLKIEPLYFILFKPFSFAFSDLAAVKISLLLTIVLAMIGLHLLAKRFGMNARERMFVLAAFALSGAAISMWYNLLRNFLALAITPFFLYFYFGDKRRDHLIAIALLILIGMAHRTAVILIAAVGIHLLYTKRYRLLLAYALGMLPLGIFYLYTLTDFIIVSASSSAIGGASLIDLRTIIVNVAMISAKIFASGFAVLPAAFFMKLRRKVDSKTMFLYILIAVSIIVSIPLDHVFASRPIFQLILPFSILAGLGLREMLKRGDNMRRMAAFSVIGMVGVAAFMVIDLDTDLTDEEMEFIESMEIPEGSTVVLPGRMLFYTKHVWGDRYVLHPLVPKPYLADGSLDEGLWAAYRGENVFGYDIYLVDANPQEPAGRPELKLLPYNGL